jgi:hypothetical protein
VRIRVDEGGGERVDGQERGRAEGGWAGRREDEAGGVLFRGIGKKKSVRCFPKKIRGKAFELTWPRSKWSLR